MFDPVVYAWSLVYDADHVGKVKKADRPVTLADHEAAEREARTNLDARLQGPSDCDIDIPEIDDCCLDGWSACIQQWAADVQAETAAWEKIANDLLAFKAKSAEAEMVEALQEEIDAGRVVDLGGGKYKKVAA